MYKFQLLSVNVIQSSTLPTLLWVYKKTMPLQLDAAHPEAYLWGGAWGRGEDLGHPFFCIFARGHMALCAVSGQFIVPLEPAPPCQDLGPGLQGHQHVKNNIV